VVGSVVDWGASVSMGKLLRRLGGKCLLGKRADAGSGKNDGQAFQVWRWYDVLFRSGGVWEFGVKNRDDRRRGARAYCRYGKRRRGMQ